RHFVGGRETAERIALERTPGDLLVSPEGGGEFRFHDAGGNGVDSDAQRPELGGELPGEHDEGRLGHPVGAEPKLGPQSRDARHVDDRASMRPHPGVDDQFGEHQWSPQVDLEGLVPGAELDIEDWAEVRVGPGVVDQDVNAPEAIQDRRDHPLRILGSAHVRRHRRGGSGMPRIDPIRRRLETLEFAAGDKDPSPLVRQRPRRRLADATASARHDRYAIGQVEIRHCQILSVGMDFDHSPRVKALQKKLGDFMAEFIYPNEPTYRQQAMIGDHWSPPPIVDELKSRARSAGLWNLFLPESDLGAGLTNLEYAPLCEIMGRVPWAPEVFNCSAPDTGNMEILDRFGTPEQKDRWLRPLLNGEIRSGFAMTE